MRKPDCIRRRLLRISNQCYDPATADEISRWTVAGAGSTNPRACTVKQDSALVGTIQLDRADAIVVACRGTLFGFGTPEQRVGTALDWLNNDECAQVPFEGNRGRVHLGFKSAIDDVWGELQPAVDELVSEKPARPIYVTGHSKGGAMAFMAAMRLRDRHPNSPIRVVTFAAARPGDSDFAAAYARSGIRTTRYECWPDPVPELPPGTMGSTLLRRFVAPLFDLPGLKDYRIADLPPFWPAGNRVPAGDWTSDARKSWWTMLRTLIGAHAVADADKLIKAHSIGPGSNYDALVCSETGADGCDHA